MTRLAELVHAETAADADRRAVARIPDVLRQPGAAHDAHARWEAAKPSPQPGNPKQTGRPTNESMGQNNAGYTRTPDYGGRAVQHEPDNPHRLEVGRPDITHEDLELARQGIPFRTVSHVAIAEAQELMGRVARGECMPYDTRDPGGRLIEAHDNSPEAEAAYKAQMELRRREAEASGRPVVDCHLRARGGDQG